jgi:HK97 family phage major capsid protein
MDIETKDAGQSATLHDLLYTFERFKEANDARLGEIERRAADPLTEEKVARIEGSLAEQKRALDALSLRAARPVLDQKGEAVPEARSAFDAYVRTGVQSAPELKSYAAGNDADGGYLAPEETERMVTSALRTVSPFRAIATVRQITANAYRKPVATGGFGAGWTAETAARTETQAPQLAALDFPTMELFAMPATTQTLLDDAIVDVGTWLAEEVQAEFAAQESRAFVRGDGVSQPKGFLSYAQADESSRGFGQIGTVAGGVDGDGLIELTYAAEQSYRQNGRFVMNRRTASSVRKLKDADGNYLWAPGLAAGQPSTLMGYPVVESEDMPDTGTPIAFGDFARGYLIVDRQGLQVLRDPFSAKPYVLFYTTKRVGGGVQDFAAIKLLKTS